MTVKVTMANNSSDSVDFINASGTTLAQVKAYDDGSSNGHVEVYTSNSGTSSEKVRVQNGLHIQQDASSSNRLVFRGQTSSSYRWNIDNYGSSNQMRFYRENDSDASGGSVMMTLDSSGNLLVGTTSQIGAEQLGLKFDDSTKNGLGIQVTGSSSGAAFTAFRNSGGTLIGSITRVTTTNAVAYNTTSDQRLKSNIEDAAPVLDKLMDVKVRQYDWTEGNLHQDYGFVAQELEPVLSGIVTKGKSEEDVWQLDYSRLTPHLVKAIQELSAKNDALEARLAALENK